MKAKKYYKPPRKFITWVCCLSSLVVYAVCSILVLMHVRLTFVSTMLLTVMTSLTCVWFLLVLFRLFVFSVCILFLSSLFMKCTTFTALLLFLCCCCFFLFCLSHFSSVFSILWRVLFCSTQTKTYQNPLKIISNSQIHDFALWFRHYDNSLSWGYCCLSERCGPWASGCILLYFLACLCYCFCVVFSVCRIYVLCFYFMSCVVLFQLVY